MNFLSIAYILFMLALVCVYYAAGRLFKRGQWIVILVFSLIFYALVGSISTLGYVVATMVISYAAARVLECIDAATHAHVKTLTNRSEKKAYKQSRNLRKRVVLCVAIACMIATLCYLKYWNTLAYYLSFEKSPHSLGLLLPLGISFYTFSALSYVIDVYNQKYTPEHNIAKYACYLTYFPQLVQGPINRYDAMAPQLFAYHKASDTHFAPASLLFMYGLLKKYVIADCLVGFIATILDANPSTYAGSVVAFGILLYSAQQYGDFSGGIDMVQASSQMLGITMQPNFRQPYFSVSLADFWRRWHISLGLWMKDYIFYPFALTNCMKRLGKFLHRHTTTHLGRTVPAGIANIVVFLLVGIWHGPEIHFVWWGLYNGVVIALSDMLRPYCETLASALHINLKSHTYYVFSIVRTFIVVNIGWYFDRIVDPNLSIAALTRTVFAFNADAFASQLGGILYRNEIAFTLACIGCVLVFCTSVFSERGIDVASFICTKHVIWRYGMYLILGALVLLAIAVTKTQGGFMYANY